MKPLPTYRTLIKHLLEESGELKEIDSVTALFLLYKLSVPLYVSIHMIQSSTMSNIIGADLYELLPKNIKDSSIEVNRFSSKDGFELDTLENWDYRKVCQQLNVSFHTSSLGLTIKVFLKKEKAIEYYKNIS